MLKKNNYCIDCGKLIWDISKRCSKCSGIRIGKSIERNMKISKSKLEDKNVNWKGDNVGLPALHEWIENRKPKPKFCECCKTNKPYDLANISGLYKRDVNDFEWLCRSCHMHRDGRLKKLHSNYKKGVNHPLWKGGRKITWKKYYEKNKEKLKVHKRECNHVWKAVK